MRVNGGEFFYMAPDGALRPAAPERPDVVISRRVADFPDGVPPAAATILACDACRAPIAWDGKFPSARHVCLQCSGIQPLPTTRAR